jgi:hypothetical protein
MRKSNSSKKLLRELGSGLAALIIDISEMGQNPVVGSSQVKLGLGQTSPEKL